MNRQPINNLAEFERAMKQNSGKSTVPLVNRNGHTRFVVIEQEQ